jgi:Archaeal/vacuolar-type H+-ATPase subunit A
VIGSVSPPGGDFSEPVTQSTLRVTKVFWALDSNLAYARHFPAINWLNSYSLYTEELGNFFKKISGDWIGNRNKAMEILQKESELMEIVRLVGVEALSNRERLLLSVARMIREDFLYQSAYQEIDTYTQIGKQAIMLEIILYFYDKALKAMERGALFPVINSMKVLGKIAEMKYASPKEIENLKKILMMR